MSFAEPPLPVPDDDALDAAASAVVDGVATPSEAALVAASPEGETRVAMLRAVAEAVALPVPDQDEAAAARALAAALGALPATGTSDSDAADEPDLVDRQGRGDDRPATVTTLPPPPASAAAARWLPRLGAMAAVLVLLAGIGALAVGLLGDSGDDAMRSSAPDGRSEATAAAQPQGPSRDSAAATPDPAGPAAAPAAPPPSSGATARTAMAASPPPVVDGGDFGSQSDLQALVQRAAAALDSEADPATSGRGTALPTDVQTCVDAGPAAANLPLGPLRYRAVGSFQGTPAVVAAFERPGDQPRLLLVLAQRGCTVLASTPF